MGFKCGIVGLPNVGKSTLFNALTRTAAAQAANFPFCTIEPNVGEVGVPDKRLDQLAEMRPQLRDDPAFVGIRLRQLAPNPDRDWRVDLDEWKQKIDLFREHYAQFGDKLPAELTQQLDALEQRLASAD